MSRSPDEIRELEDRVAAVSSWYHAIDLGDGVRTPGAFDLDPYLDDYGLPDRMDGMRVLDLGAASGFFSCEFERRGAAEVVAVDLPGWGAHDWTPRYRARYEAKPDEEKAYIDQVTMRAGFDLVTEALGCHRVRKVETTIYDLEPGEIGRFDFVFCGSMLMHVRDPVLGLQRLRAVCRDDSELNVSISTAMADVDEPVARFAGAWDQCNWWQMNPRCLDKVLACCDFDLLGPGHTFVLRSADGQFEDPTYVVRARPRRG